MLWSPSHHIPDALDKRDGDLGMEEVTHRVDKDQTRARPPKRLVDLVPVQSQPKTWAAPPGISVQLVPGVPCRPQSLGQGERVAVITPRTDTIASGRRVPGGRRPLDPGAIAHSLSFVRAIRLPSDYRQPQTSSPRPARAQGRP